MVAVLRKIKADIISRPIISLMVTITIFTSAMLLTLALATLLNMSAPYDRTFAELNGAHVWLFFDRQVTSRHDIDRIAALPGVSASTGLRTYRVSRVRIGDQQVWTSLQALPDTTLHVNRLLIDEGEDSLQTEHRASDAYRCMASKDLGDLYGVAVGDEIEVTRTDGKVIRLPVTALAYNPMWDTYRNSQPPYIYVTEAALKSLFPDESEWGWSMGLRLTEPQAVDAMVKTIEETLRADVVASTTDWRDVRRSAVFGAKINFIFLGAFSFFAVLATILVIASSISAIVLSQYREIGVLKALGFTQQQVLWLYVGQYLLLDLIGCFPGLVVGVALSPLPLRSVAASLSAAFRPPLSFPLVALVLLVTAGVVTLATLSTAYRGARTNIVRAIAVGAEPPRRTKRSGLALASRMGLPIILLLGLQDVFTRPFRSFLTALNLTLGVIGIVFGLTLNATLDAHRDDPSLLGIPYDAVVTRAQISDAKARHILNRLRDVEGDITAIYSEYLIEAETDDGATFQARAVAGDLAAFPIHLSAGRRFRPYTQEAIAGQGLLDWLNLEVGDTLTVTLTEGRSRPIAWTIVGQYTEPVNVGQMMMVSAPALASWVGERAPERYYLKLAPHADPHRLRASLRASSHDGLSMTLVEQALPDAVVYLQAAIYALSAILVGIALINVFNTSLLATKENVRTIGVLKTVGMTPAQVMAMVNTTAAFLGLVATVVGVPLGFIFTRSLLAGVALSYGFGAVTVRLSPLVGLLLVPLMLLVSTAGSAIPSVRAARLPIVEVLRHG